MLILENDELKSISRIEYLKRKNKRSSIIHLMRGQKKRAGRLFFLLISGRSSIF